MSPDRRRRIAEITKFVGRTRPSNCSKKFIVQAPQKTSSISKKAADGQQNIMELRHTDITVHPTEQLYTMHTTCTRTCTCKTSLPTNTKATTITQSVGGGWVHSQSFLISSTHSHSRYMFLSSSVNLLFMWYVPREIIPEGASSWGAV